MSAAPDTLPVLRSRIAGLLGELRKLADPTGPGGALLATMSEAEAGGEIEAIKDGARRLAKAVEALEGQLRDALMQAEQIESAQRRDILGSETYWLELRQALRDATARSADAVLSVWFKSFAEAFVAWQLDVCERLTHEASLATPKLEDLQRTLSLAIKTLRSDDRAAAVPGLELLLNEHQAGSPKSSLDNASRAAVLLVLGRIRLYDIADDVAALACFERAREVGPQDGRVRAALAEYYRTKNDDASARDLDRQAIAASPDQPEGYVGMALSCEIQGWWDEAQDWYSQAVDVALRRAASDDPLGELGQLLAPVSGALYLRLAQTIGTANPTTGLSAVDKAIKLGIEGEGKYPQRAAFQVKGQILESLEHPLEAAEAFFQAGRYNAWENNADVACKLHERANGLDPQLVANYWSWADALLITSSVSKPPFVDPGRIAQSLDVWNCGVDLALPDEEHGWTYLTRAVAAEQLANLPGADRWERSWETVAFVEQALLLRPLRTDSWVVLGRTHHALGNDLTALHAVETALLCDPEDVSAISQRLIILANLDRYADVRPLLAKLSTMGLKPGWLNAVEAHVALYESLQDGRAQGYEAALAASDVARSSGWDEPWSCIDRARLLHLVGRTDEAGTQYERLWHKFHEQDVGNLLNYAWAALMIGEYDAALSIFAGRSADRVSGLTIIQRQLGFCRLLRGELASARSHFDRSIELANSVRELGTWLIGDLESAEVLRQLTGRPHAKQARHMLDQCKTSAINRRAALRSPSSPLQEVQRLIAALEADNEIAGWSWIGAQATVARLNLETHGWREANELYRTLQDYPGRFYTAQHGLEQALYGLVAEERGTAAEYESILSTAESDLPKDRTRLAGFHDQRANIERRRRLTRLFGRTAMQLSPVVMPIAIEAAENLGPLLQGDSGDVEPQFPQHLSISNMRSGLYDLLGFTVPSVSVRIHESDLPDGTYVITVNEVPLVSGNIDLTRGLCNETVDRLTRLNVKGEEAVNPVNGCECSWVGEGDWQNVRQAGLDIWCPAEYIVLHLSAVVRKHAVELVGIQAVSDLLKHKANEQYSSILSAKGGLPRFTRVIQALLAEEVPVRELSSICDCYLENQNGFTYEIPEQIRCLEAVRKEILGNTPDTPIYRLGENLVSLITLGIKRDGEAAVLALEPEPTQDALTAVRNEVANAPPTSRNPVLFVEDWRMRSFTRKLVELEFPHLAVLSRREALVPDARQVLATIEVESRPRPDNR